MSLSITHIISTDEIAYALAGYSDHELGRFADDLIESLCDRGEEHVARTLVASINTAAESSVLANADGRK